jgi:hypothetical protein
MTKFKFTTKTAIALYAMLAVVLSSCNLKYNDNPHNIKYKVTLNSGLQQTHYFVLSEIEYLPNGCIKFEQFAYGKIDTAAVCGNFAIENYR